MMSVLRESQFRRLIAADFVSELGSQVSLLALPLVALLFLDVNTVEFGFLTALGYFPTLLVTPFAGVLVDRKSARSVALVGDICRGVLLLGIPVMGLAGRLSVVGFALVIFANGFLKALTEIAHYSLLPFVVTEPEKRQAANSLVSMMYSVLTITGPVLAGLLLQVVAAPLAIVCDALSFLLSGALLSKLRTEAAPRTAKDPWWKSFAGGVSYLRQTPGLLVLAAAAGSVNLVLEMFMVAVLIMLTRQLHASPAVIGVIFAVAGVGGIVGAASAPIVKARFGLQTAVVAGLAFMWCGLAITLLAALRVTGYSTCLVALGDAVASAGVALFSVSAITARQALCRLEMMGRVTSVMKLISHGSIPLGAAAGGLVTATVGGAGAVGAGVVILPACIWWVSRQSAAFDDNNFALAKESI